MWYRPITFGLGSDTKFPSFDLVCWPGKVDLTETGHTQSPPTEDPNWQFVKMQVPISTRIFWRTLYREPLQGPRTYIHV